MIDRRMIDQLLGQLHTGALDLQQQGGQVAGQVNQQLDQRLGENKGLVGGIAVGGLAALLLSNKKVRKMGKKAAVYGGAAALGAVAFNALRNRQQNASPPGSPSQAPTPAPTLEHDPLAGHAAFQPDGPAESAPDEDAHVKLLLSAMVAAANADGHVTGEERGRITATLEQLALDQEARLFLLDELMAPKKLSDIARAVTTPQQGAEVYLMSSLVLDREEATGRQYLDDLSMVLNLDPSTRETLDAQASGAAPA